MFLSGALTGLAIWIGLGCIAAGWEFAYFRRKYQSDFNECKCEAQGTILMGAIAFLALGTSQFSSRGWLWPWSEKAKREAGLA